MSRNINIIVDGVEQTVEVWGRKAFNAEYERLLSRMPVEDADAIMAGVMVMDACEMQSPEPEPPAAVLPPTSPPAGTAHKSSFQKLLAALPPTARRIYDVGRDLAALNPRGDGSFDLGGDDRQLKCAQSTASTHIQLLVTTRLWVRTSRASFKGRLAATYRIAREGEIDFEAAIAACQEFRQKANTRLKKRLAERLKYEVKDTLKTR